MPEPLFRRAEKAAHEAAQGAPESGVPRMESESYLAETRHLPQWGKEGRILKRYYVYGVAGESVFGSDGRFYSKHFLPLGDREVAIQHAPLGWVDIGNGRRALFSVHPHGNSELSIIVHGTVDDANPEVVRREYDAVVKRLPDMAGDSKVRMDVEMVRHAVRPVSKDERPVVEGQILSLLRRDLASVYSRRMDEHYWRVVEKASRDFGEIFQGIPESKVYPAERITPREPSISDFTQVQKIIASHPDIGKFERYAITHAVADFQREVAWRLYQKGAENRGIRVAKIRSAVSSKDVVDLTKWPAYHRIVDMHMRYLRTLQDAVRNGKLRVNFIHRTG